VYFGRAFLDVNICESPAFVHRVAETGPPFVKPTKDQYPNLICAGSGPFFAALRRAGRNDQMKTSKENWMWIADF